MTDELRLDGNAVAGALGEVFALEITAAAATCAACGAVGDLGGSHAYVHAPGVVVRCTACESVLLRLARSDGRFWLDLRGIRCLELRG
jgi:hypothetical protein